MPTATPNFTQTPRTPSSELTAADTTVAKDVVVAPGGGLRIDMIGVSSTDSGPRNITFTINDGTNDRLSWTVAVPASSGSAAGINAVSALNRTLCPFLNDDGAIWLESGFKLRWNSGTTITVGTAIRCTAFSGAWL